MREQLAFGADTMREALLALRQYIDEGFSSRRVIVLGGGLVADGPEGGTALTRFSGRLDHVPLETSRPHLYVFSGA